MNFCSVLMVGALSFLLAGVTPGLGQEAAEQRQGFAQSAAFSFNVASIIGRPGQALPLTISIDGAAEDLRALVMIRGIPSQLKLSSGFLNGDAWLVSMAELDKLRLVVPDDYQGRFDIEVMFVQVESKRRQTRSASVTIRPAAQPEERLLVLEEGNQTQTRSVQGMVLPKRRPRDRLQAAKSGKPPTQVKAGVSPATPLPGREKGGANLAVRDVPAPRSAITCEGISQVQKDGTRIVTPYCQDGNLADVARRYGVRTSAQAMRYDVSEKGRVCRFIGDDIRVRSACEAYRNENVRR